MKSAKFKFFASLRDSDGKDIHCFRIPKSKFYLFFCDGRLYVPTRRIESQFGSISLSEFSRGLVYLTNSGILELLPKSKGPVYPLIIVKNGRKEVING